MLFYVKFDVKEFRWRKHELVRVEHVYTCPLDQSQGNVRRKVETYWVQRCVSVKRRVWTGDGRGGSGSISSWLKLEKEKVFFCFFVFFPLNV